jgi:hypothetical protein
MRQAGRGEAGILGLGAACLACCAGPILAFLGGLGIAGLASTLFIGGAGLAVAAVAAAFVVVRRRSRCAVADESPVAVAAPARRAPLS